VLLAVVVGGVGFLSSFSIRAIQFQEMNGRGILELDAQVTGDLAQGMVEVREVVDGHVANEGAADFVVAGAAVQPAEEEE
jgi:predicted RecA/RadA family phage recombinase